MSGPPASRGLSESDIKLGQVSYLFLSERGFQPSKTLAVASNSQRQLIRDFGTLALPGLHMIQSDQLPSWDEWATLADVAGQSSAAG